MELQVFPSVHDILALVERDFWIRADLIWQRVTAEMVQFMFVLISLVLDWISYRISHVHARMVLGLLSGMIVMYYSLPMISCAQRIFQYFSPCMGAVSYTHLRAHETPEHLVLRLMD